MSGRGFIIAGTLLLLATAAVHGAGLQAVLGWLEGLGAEQRQGLALVWLAVAFDWVVTAVLWSLAAWWLCREWLITGLVAAAIPLAVGAGTLAIDPTFFGGWMLIGSAALFTLGAMLGLRQSRMHHE